MEDFKSTKTRDQGMENYFFVVCFKICIGGLGWEMRVGFLWGLWGFLKSLQVYFVEIIFTSEALILKFKFLKMIKTLTLKKQICNLDETTLANNKLSG